MSSTTSPPPSGTTESTPAEEPGRRERLHVEQGAEITESFDRSMEEGARRLNRSTGNLLATGLMAGIELAPPTDGMRWGRRVSAGCVERGVLIRPLGDVVVVVPPLTTTEAEIDRIVDTVAAAVGDVCA